MFVLYCYVCVPCFCVCDMLLCVCVPCHVTICVCVCLVFHTPDSCGVVLLLFCAGGVTAIYVSCVHFFGFPCISVLYPCSTLVLIILSHIPSELCLFCLLMCFMSCVRHAFEYVCIINFKDLCYNSNYFICVSVCMVMLNNCDGFLCIFFCFSFYTDECRMSCVSVWMCRVRLSLLCCNESNKYAC